MITERTRYEHQLLWTAYWAMRCLLGAVAGIITLAVLLCFVAFDLLTLRRFEARMANPVAEVVFWLTVVWEPWGCDP